MPVFVFTDSKNPAYPMVSGVLISLLISPYSEITFWGS